MAWRISFFSSTCSEIAMAIFSLIPFTSDKRSGSSSIIRKVSALKRRTIRAASAAPIPFTAPDPR